MFTIFLVGVPVILINMLLQSLVSVWCIRFYIKRFGERDGVLAGVLALFGIITLVMLGNLAQIVIWGALFLWLGGVQHLAGGHLSLRGQLRHPGLRRHRHEPAVEDARTAGSGQRRPDDRPLRRLHAGGLAAPYSQAAQ